MAARSRLSELMQLLLGIALLLLAGCTEHRDRQSEVWRFAIEETRGSVQDAYARRFAELVEESTEGVIRVVVYPYGALGTSDQITEQLHNGTLQFAMSSPGHLGKLIPEVQAFLLHFLLSEDEDVNARALGDPVLQEFLDGLYAEKGLAFLTAFGEGWQVWTTRTPVRRPEDFAGIRFRVMTSPLLIASYEQYGASPTPLPYAEVYSALQLHMIDGQVNPVFAIEEMSFYEVTDYLIFPRHAEFITTVAANARFFDGLQPDRRRMVKQILARLQVEIDRVQRRYNHRRLEDILAQRPDIRVIRLSKAERSRFRALARKTRERYLELAGPRGAKLLDLIEEAIERAKSR